MEPSFLKEEESIWPVQTNIHKPVPKKGFLVEIVNNITDQPKSIIDLKLCSKDIKL